MNFMPFGQLKSFLKILIEVQYEKGEKRSCFGWRSRCFWWWLLWPICISRRKRSIDNLKIAMFRHQSAGETTCQEERPIHGITRYLQEHLAEEISLSVLAEQFHLSAQYISQLFKSEIGVNFLAYLTNIRMERAKKLLLTTSLSIAQVSEQSGYGDYRVFTKVFKKSEGITPSQYRRDFLEKE